MKKEKIIDKKCTLAIIVPCCEEENCIEDFYTEVTKHLSSANFLSSYEIVFIDDGSKDNTLNIIKNLQMNDKRIKYISLSRNFGKESAIYAGLDQTIKNKNYDYWLIMDADLQDPPELISKMIIKLSRTDECECVRARRTSRKGEPALRTVFSKLFYKIINSVSDINLKSGTRDFCIMTRKYVNALLECAEYNRFFKGISSWVGFNVAWIEYENVQRKKGQSQWSFFQLFKYSLQAIIAYTTWPLTCISFLGVILSIVAFIFLIIVFIRALCFGDPVAGWPSLICIILVLGGLILFSLGVLGLYFEKIYLEVKNRPIYIIHKIDI